MAACNILTRVRSQHHLKAWPVRLTVAGISSDGGSDIVFMSAHVRLKKVVAWAAWEPDPRKKRSPKSKWLLL
jgi:hypothetical protein